MDITNLENIVSNKNLLQKINGQSRNSQLHKLIVLVIETTSKPAKSVLNATVSIKGNHLETEIYDWAKLIANLINISEKALSEANSLLDPKSKDPLNTKWMMNLHNKSDKLRQRHKSSKKKVKICRRSR
jgi:hypothetical protein